MFKLFKIVLFNILLIILIEYDKIAAEEYCQHVDWIDYYDVTYSNDYNVLHNFWIDLKNINESKEVDLKKSFILSTIIKYFPFEFPFFDTKISLQTFEPNNTSNTSKTESNDMIIDILTPGIRFNGKEFKEDSIQPFFFGKGSFLKKTNDSKVYYHYNGTSFIVQWDNFYYSGHLISYMEEKLYYNHKPLSAEIILKSNGDILFLYKVPFQLSKLPKIYIGLNRVNLNKENYRKIIYFSYPLFDNTTEGNKINADKKVIYFKLLSGCKIYKTDISCTENFDSKSSKCLWCEKIKKCFSIDDLQHKERIENKCSSSSNKIIDKKITINHKSKNENIVDSKSSKFSCENKSSCSLFKYFRCKGISVNDLNKILFDEQIKKDRSKNKNIINLISNHTIESNNELDISKKRNDLNEKRNKLIEKRNELIGKQNRLLKIEIELIKEQNQLLRNNTDF